jgi:adenine-specific DNA-methyltransferase
MASDENPIPPVTRDDPASHSGDVMGENVAALKALFPSIVTDGKVDFDVLRQLLGDEVEEGAERYGLNWKGKARARAFALTPSLGTLRPAQGDSKDWDTTRNIVIEGDNLEVLKLLRKSYAGKVKLIYIDPPYNTGKDFVYPDNYTDSLANYETLTGQRGEDGARMTSNKEASGRFHTDWLNMMYPRLMLAKELLREDGFIVVSLDDNEVASVRKIFDETLGEENFVANVVWRRTVSLAVSGEGVAVAHDHIIVYSRTPLASVNRLLVADEDSYSNSDNDPRGPYKKQKLERTLEGARPTMTFAIQTPVGPITKTWSVNPDKFQELLADNRIVFSGSGLLQAIPERICWSSSRHMVGRARRLQPECLTRAYSADG